MTRSRLGDDEYLTDHPVRSGLLGVGYGWLVGLVVIAVVGITTLGLWAGGVLFSPEKGRAQAFEQQQSATNRIFAQQHFETLYGDIKAGDAQLAVFATDEKRFPGNQTWVTDFSGTQALCLSNVAQYDQDAHKYLLKDFRTADLPAQIDPNDPTTDCKG